MQDKLTELKARLAEVDDLQAAGEILYWDQSTYMPPGGAAARGRQAATLARLAQEKFTDPAVGRLLADLRPYEESLDYDHDDAGLIRVTRREYERHTRIPADFVAEFFRHKAASYQAWTEARARNDFAAVQPFLEKTLSMSRQMAQFFPGFAHIADPLIAFADHGMTVATLRPLFARLRDELVPLVAAIAARPKPADGFLRQEFAEQPQWDFGLDIVQRFGYDLTRGRQDRTHHPYTVKFSIDDVRITTNLKGVDLLEPLLSTLHEAGHAMYEQGIDPAFEATPLANGTSSGVHESQSRLYENVIGRSPAFWAYFYPRLQQLFPDQLAAVSDTAFVRAVNKVQPGLIRVNADEITYNLHVIIRFELELALLEGALAVADLPEAWHGKYQDYLGVRAPDDRDGVMQDVHWYHGRIGGVFQGYTLGNLIGAALWEAALAAHPEIMDEMAVGRFDVLHSWLVANVHRHGSKYTAGELIERVTGEPLTIDPYLRYLRTKYADLYQL